MSGFGNVHSSVARVSKSGNVYAAMERLSTFGRSASSLTRMSTFESRGPADDSEAVAEVSCRRLFHDNGVVDGDHLEKPACSPFWLQLEGVSPLVALSAEFASPGASSSSSP